MQRWWEKERQTETERQKEIPVFTKERVHTKQIPRIGVDLFDLRNKGRRCVWVTMGDAQDGPAGQGPECEDFLSQAKECRFYSKDS